MNPPSAPAPSNKRIASLDVIRGFAILGILLMNIQSFSMPASAYLNPTSFGDLSGANFVVWLISHLFADYKFLSLFSMLFGASILLICERAEAAGQSVWKVHYARNFWLLVIGAGHAYLLWHGDILFPYAICAMLMFLFRKRSPRFLIITGLLLFSIGSSIYFLSGISMPSWPEADVADLREGTWAPSETAIEEEIAAFRGSFGEQMEERVEKTVEMQTTVFLLLFIWRISGLMLLGMAFYKSGFLTMRWNLKAYLRTGLLAALIGFLLTGIGAYRNFGASWSLEYSMFLGSQWNYWGSLLVAIAYAALLQVFLLLNADGIIQRSLAAVGRMALSNYLLQTLLATSIFYGFGLGLFAQVSRLQQAGIVLLIWAVLIAFSLLWSRHYHYGPFEWLWRSLTRMKVQTLKRPSQG